MKFYKLMLLLILFSSPLVKSDDCDSSNHKNLIDGYFSAYNRCNLEKTASYLHDNIQWYSVKGSEIEVVSKNKIQLVAMLKDYFDSGCNVTSSINKVLINGPFLTTVEKASWTNGSGQSKSQSSVSVYQIKDNLIYKIWYYPEVHND